MQWKKSLKHLGEPDEWQAEWKWDGIRGQIIKRNNELFVWSRGEELMTDKFPEYFILKDLLPDGIVLDGEIIPAVDGKPLTLCSFANTHWQKKYWQRNNYRKHLSVFLLMIFWNIIMKTGVKNL